MCKPKFPHSKVAIIRAKYPNKGGLQPRKWEQTGLAENVACIQRHDINPEG